MASKMYYTRISVLLVLACTSIWGVYSTESQPKVQNGTKIVGGSATTIEKYPYQVYLSLTRPRGSRKYGVACGGSIVKSRCILTAAHCLNGWVKSDRFESTYLYCYIFDSATIRAGSTNSSSGGTTYTSRMFTIHPQFNTSTRDYDIGIIRLVKPIKIDGQNTSAINTLSACSVTAGTNVTVTGWGRTEETGRSSTTLMEVSLDIVSTEECKRQYPGITPRMICASVPEGGKDSCQGDSGGPLVRTGTKTQVGIVSYGNGCGRRDIPGVYTNLCDRDIQNWLESMYCL